jgi:DUF1009 family protein
VELVCVGHRHFTSPEVFPLCHIHRNIGLGRLGAAIRFFRRHGVREVTMAGWIRKEQILGPWRWLRHIPDWRMLKLWYFQVRNRQDHSLLGAVADELEKEGIHVAHSTKYCPELLVEEGVLTRRAPSRAQLEDIRFGWVIAKRLAELEVGQCIVVMNRATVAVEGIEGTDRTIRRAGELLPRGGFTVLKLAKQGHDMRFDVPTVGPETIETIHAAKGSVLALEAGRTLLIDRESAIEQANRHGLVIVALREPPPA